MLIVSIVLLSGCGSQQTDGLIEKEEGTVLLKIKKSDIVSSGDDVNDEKNKPQLVPADTVAVHLKIYNEETVIMRQYALTQDVTTVSLKVPAGTYTIEGITLDSYQSFPYEAFTIGSTSLVVKAGVQTTETLTLIRPQFNIEIYRNAGATLVDQDTSLIEGERLYVYASVPDGAPQKDLYDDILEECFVSVYLDSSLYSSTSDNPYLYNEMIDDESTYWYVDVPEVDDDQSTLSLGITFWTFWYGEDYYALRYPDTNLGDTAIPSELQILNAEEVDVIVE